MKQVAAGQPLGRRHALLADCALVVKLIQLLTRGVRKSLPAPGTQPKTQVANNISTERSFKYHLPSRIQTPLYLAADAAGEIYSSLLKRLECWLRFCWRADIERPGVRIWGPVALDLIPPQKQGAPTKVQPTFRSSI